MAGTPTDDARPGAAGLVEHFFRHETARLHAALARILGARDLALIEDIAQEAMLRAMRAWSIGGVPDNPSAWITAVAQNLARDALRHQRVVAAKETRLDPSEGLEPAYATPAVASAAVQEIRDDALRLLFVCCHPSLPQDAQAVLALKLLCGFTTGEIARAFLATEAAIEKQLTRTRQRVREANPDFALPEGTSLGARLNGVLATIYLLFNEGYKASFGDRLLREDLCGEAIRLAELLVAHPVGDVPRAHALLALMLLHAARFPARVDGDGVLLPLRDQDRSLWDQARIDRGLASLARAARGGELSEYHVQAGIAALHCTAPDVASTDWHAILRHYDVLTAIRPSPVVALNRAVAVAHVHGPDAALAELAAMPQRERLDSYYLLHAVAGELHWRRGDRAAAAASFRRALALATVGPEQAYLAHRLDGLGTEA
ncbi:MAG TPA: sigma-70 family RNA polymerase sigma factor [Planctomycetota bacterium]|nr:sigma-70 family RNA polymerase sigma factor [Planctomycetota bacterium]